MFKIKKPKYILFDVGNVLVYKVTHEDENIADLLGMTRDEYRAFLDQIIGEQTESETSAFKNMNTVEKEKMYLDDLHRKMCKKLNIKEDEDFIDKMTKFRMQGDFALKENVLEALEKLGKKYSLGIFTNSLPSRRYYELKIGGLDKYFKHIFISKEIGLEKPEPEAYKYVLSKINYNVKDVMFVDDKSSYLEGAKKAGISNLIMLKNKEESLEYPMINDLLDLVSLLEK